jgi:hypothetical protein
MTSHEGAALSSPPPRQPPVWAGFFDEGARVRSLHPVREIARLTHGADCFDSGAARQLAELLRAVAVFATGGLTALADQHHASAVRLSQLR